MIAYNSLFNPWTALPDTGPFVLPADREVLQSCGRRVDSLHFESVPDPFIGDPAKAQIYLLALNPGFRPAGNDSITEDELYQSQTRANVLHEADPPFYYLTPGLEASDGYRWWHHIFNALINTGVPVEVLAEHMMAVQFFPYRSETYTDLGKTLPSQKYSFELVRHAVLDKKQIVIMRSEKLWLQAVPELADYPYMTVRNVRRPTLSPANLGQDNFNRLIRDIEHATARERFIGREGEFEVIGPNEPQG